MINMTRAVNIVFSISPYIILFTTLWWQRRRERVREYWLRKINSYEHFYKYANQVINWLYLKHNINTGDWKEFWELYLKMDEAYYDISFYDRRNSVQIDKVKQIRDNVWNVIKNKLTIESKGLIELRRKVEQIYQEFQKEEKLVTPKTINN